MGNIADKAKTAVTKQNNSVPQTMAGLNSAGISNLLGRYKGAIAQALPKHLTAEKIVSMVTTLVSQNPELANCSTSSIIGTTLQASILGFDITPALGFCYFVPYNRKVGNSWIKEAQFQIGYRGFQDLATRGGQVSFMKSFIVNTNDEFHVEYGLDPKIKHVPNFDDPGEFRAVYSVAKLKDGSFMFEILTKKELNKIRAASKSGDSGPWVSWFEEMAKAKAAKRLSKWLPLSIEYKNIQTDEKIIDLKDFNPGGELDHNKIKDPEFAHVIEDGDNFVDAKTGEILNVSDLPGEITDDDPSVENILFPENGKGKK